MFYTDARSDRIVSKLSFSYFKIFPQSFELTT